MKIALVHDWLTGMRGGERVLEALCELFPESDLFTLIHLPGSVSKTIEERIKKTSFIQNIPLNKSFYRSMLPLFPLAIESFNLNEYDLVISTSHCVAKGIIPGPRTLHISYIFTPMRYIWDRRFDYLGNQGGLKSLLIRLFSHYLRVWDTSSNNRVDHFVAISRHISNRVRTYYRRDADVLYPFVDSRRFSISTPIADNVSVKGKTGYYLIVSAFAPYKRIDLAIDAFRELGHNLKIIGSGQDENKLKAMASPNIEFLGNRSDPDIAEYYKNCKALIFPGEEDFGIVPLEAMSAGRPVIAYGKGGALETIIPLFNSTKGQATGIFFYEPTVMSLVEAVRIFEKNEFQFNSKNISAHAGTFDKEFFMKKMREFIFSKYNLFQERGKC